MDQPKRRVTEQVQRIKEKFRKKVLQPLIRPLYLDLQPDYRRTIFLAGTERSGTTWLSDVINYNHAYRYIFEPFWPKKVSICQQFRAQQYLRPENQDPYFLNAAETILSGRIRNAWTDKFHRKVLATQRLIKDVRVNLLLKWLHTHFPAMPIVFVIRHPCAVVHSQLKLRHSTWRHDLQKEFLNQQELVEDFLAPFAPAMSEATNYFDLLIFRWCVQNYVPLQQFQNGEIYMAFYEHFCVDPERETRKLFAYLGKPYDPRLLATVAKPSPVAKQGSAIVAGNNLIDNWRKHVSAEQIARAQEILGLFGLDQLYGTDSMPKCASPLINQSKPDGQPM